MNDPEEKMEIDLDTSEDLELEIVDDTPEEDKGKARRASDADPQIPEDDEVANYSENVQKRFKQMKWEYHEERRAKEESARLREEAVKYAQSVYAENQKLRQTLSQGENVLQDQAKRRVEAEMERAKYNYKNADNWWMPEEYKQLNIVDYILGLSPEENYNRCFEELEEFKKRDMLPMLQFLVYMVDQLKHNNILWGVGRGSSVSSYILYLIGVHKIDSVKYNLDYKEFLR